MKKKKNKDERDQAKTTRKTKSNHIQQPNVSKPNKKLKRADFSFEDSLIPVDQPLSELTKIED